MSAPEKVIQCKRGWWWERCGALVDVCWKGSIWWWYSEQWEPGRLEAEAKNRIFLGQEMAEGGETRWCPCFLGLCQSSAAAWDVTPIPPIFPAASAGVLTLWGFLFSSLASFFLLLCLSLGCRSRSLAWALAHFLWEAKLRSPLSAKKP